MTHDDLRDVIAAWVHGWAISRGVPAPQALSGGARLQVGLPGHRVRYVLHRYDERLLADLGRHADPGTWIKITAEPAGLRAALGPAWTMADTGYLMTVALGSTVHLPPEPYTVQVSSVDRATIAAVLDAAGRTAATGRLALWNGFGIDLTRLSNELTALVNGFRH
jgi:hypothetical protein